LSVNLFCVAADRLGVPVVDLFAIDHSADSRTVHRSCNAYRCLRNDRGGALRWGEACRV
jgi:hypothetical protein